MNSTQPNANSISRVRWDLILLAMLMAAAAVALTWRSREPEKPRKYRVTGTVTYLDEAVPSGDMFLEPQRGTINRWTAARAFINDGNYQADVVGGPHRIILYSERFPHQLYFTVAFPDSDDVGDTEIVTFDIELPPLVESPTPDDAESAESDNEPDNEPSDSENDEGALFVPTLTTPLEFLGEEEP